MGSDSKGFTSAGGRRDSSVKELRWREGSLYSGDDAGLICKWDCMLNLVCASGRGDHSLLVYRYQQDRRGWSQVAELSAHTDQISSIAISSDTSQLCAAAWDGKV